MNQVPNGDSLPNASPVSDRSRAAALFIPLLIVCYLFITSTVSLSAEIPVYDVKRIGQFILLVIVFFTALANSAIRRRFASQMSRLPKPARIGIALFFSLGFVSAVVNADSTRGLIYSLVDAGLLGLILVMTLVLAACRHLAGTTFDRLVLSAITLLGLAVGVQELTGFWAASSAGGAYHFDIALAYFSFPRMFNQLQTWTIPVLAALPFVFSRTRLVVVLCVLSLGLNWYVLLVTGARGSVISLAAAFMVASLLSPLARKTIFKWQTAGVLLGILIYIGLFFVIEFGADRVSVANSSVSSESTVSAVGRNTLPAANSNRFYERSIGRTVWQSSGRVSLWRSALNDGKENPLLGIGPMNFACKGPTGRVGSPHNFALQILSEWGIPAVLILLALGLPLLWMLFNGLRLPFDKKNPVDLLRLLLITSVLAALVHLSVSSLLLTPASQVAASLVTGWLLGIIPLKNATGKNRLAIVIITCALLSSVSLLPFAYQETTRMEDYRVQLPAEEDGVPRLWQLGRACRSDVH